NDPADGLREVRVLHGTPCGEGAVRPLIPEEQGAGQTIWTRERRETDQLLSISWRKSASSVPGDPHPVPWGTQGREDSDQQSRKVESTARNRRAPEERSAEGPREREQRVHDSVFFSDHA